MSSKILGYNIRGFYRRLKGNLVDVHMTNTQISDGVCHLVFDVLFTEPDDDLEVPH